MQHIPQFNGLLCAPKYQNNTQTKLKDNITDISLLNLALTIEKATYKVHLMPTEQSLLHTVHALFKLFHENPKINNQYSIKDLIASVKIKLNF